MQQAFFLRDVMVSLYFSASQIHFTQNTTTLIITLHLLPHHWLNQVDSLHRWARLGSNMQQTQLACYESMGGHWQIIEVNSPSPTQNGRNFADDIFKCIFVNEKFCISIRISLKFVPKSAIDNKPALVQVMAWHRTGDRRLLTQFPNAYMRH